MKLLLLWRAIQTFMQCDLRRILRSKDERGPEENCLYTSWKILLLGHIAHRLCRPPLQYNVPQHSSTTNLFPQQNGRYAMARRGWLSNKPTCTRYCSFGQSATIVTKLQRNELCYQSDQCAGYWHRKSTRARRASVSKTC